MRDTVQSADFTEDLKFHYAQDDVTDDGGDGAEHSGGEEVVYPYLGPRKGGVSDDSSSSSEEAPKAPEAGVIPALTAEQYHIAIAEYYLEPKVSLIIYGSYW